MHLQLSIRDSARALIAVPLATLVAPFVCATPLTLDDAVERALSSNSSLAVARYGIVDSDFDVAAAEEAFSIRVRPTVGYSSRSDEHYASYGVTAEKLMRTGTKIGAAVTRNEGRLATGDPFSVDRVSLELRQPLFRNFGTAATTVALAASEAGRRRQIRDFDRARADLALRVVREYADVVRLRAQVATWRESLRRVELLHRTLRRQRRLDALQAGMLRAEAENRLKAGIDSLAAAERALALSLGVPLDTRFELAPLPMPAPIEIAETEAVATALAHRLDYAQALDDRSSALREARLVARNRYPDLSLFVRFQHFTEPLSAAEVAAFGGDGVAVGLTGGFDTTLAAGGIARARGESRLEAADAAVVATVARIEVEVRGLLDTSRQAFRDAEAAETRVELARRRAQLARRLFNAGRADADSVADAEVALTAAESERSTARSRVVTGTYSLAHGIGTLLDTMVEPRP